MNLNDWLLLFKAFEEYRKEKDLYDIANRIGCDSARFTGSHVNRTFRELNALLDKYGISYKNAKDVLYGQAA